MGPLNYENKLQVEEQNIKKKQKAIQITKTKKIKNL